MGGFPRWRIRAATPDDAEAIAQAHLAAGLAAWSHFLGAERFEAVNRGLRHPADLAAEDDAGVFGYVAWDASTGEITRLYTHPRAWGHCAGRALLDAALEALREAGCRQAWLNTEERGERTCRFYERHGWHRDGAVRERDWHGVPIREPRYVRDL